MRIAAGNLLLLALVAALARAAAAAPTGGLELAIGGPAGRDGEDVRFVGACAECEPEQYCEAAYPGAPDGSLACVRYDTARHLYRRYTYSVCATGKFCSGGAEITSGEAYPGAGTYTQCQTKCQEAPDCKIWAFDSDSSLCELKSSCVGVLNAAAGSAYGVRSDYTCPT